MNKHLAHLLRPIASLALAVALAAPIALAPRADAQFGRQLPSPVSAAQFETMLLECGMPDSTKDTALPLHEAYFKRFREFEEREVDPTFAKGKDNLFDLSRTVANAKKDAEARRRIFERAAQLDDQLTAELAGLLPSQASESVERLRLALVRRRCAALAPPFGLGAKALEFNICAQPVFADLDPEDRRFILHSLFGYEAEFARLLESYATAAINRSVRVAELREEMGLNGGPDAAPAADGEQPAEQAPPGEEWFKKMRDVQAQANVECNKIAGEIRKLQRDALDNVSGLLEPIKARTLRNAMLSAVYPTIRTKSEFDTVADLAVAKRKKKELDESKFPAVTALLESHELSVRPLYNDLMSEIDAHPPTEDGIGIRIIMSGDQQDENATDERAMDERAKADDKLKRLRDELAGIDTRDADTLRALLGIEKPADVDGKKLDRVGIQDAIQGAIGGAIAGEATIAVSAVMAGPGGDNMIVLSGDDMMESGMFFGGFGGGGQRVPRPMNGEEIDQLANKLGFGKDTRGLLDEIIARAVEARTVAEKELAPKQQQIEVGGADGGAMTFQLSVGGDGEVSGFASGDNPKLIEAIDTLEEQMFDELKAVVANDKNDALAAARRARARVRLLPGETGAQSADLVAIVEAAALADAARAKVAGDLKSWDEASVDSIRSMKSEVKTLEAERYRLFQNATKEVTEDSGNGQVKVSQAVQIEGETVEKLQAVESKITKARGRIADNNRRTVDTLVAALDGDIAAQKAVRRGFLRAANPSVYRGMRDLEPFFTKAAAIEGMSDSAKAKLAAMRSDWIETRETRCESYIEDMRKASEAKASEARGAKQEDPSAQMASMQNRMREQKKLREDLEQIEASSFRKLQEMLLVEVGAEKAKDIGELPAKKKRAMPTIQFGG